MKLGRQIIERIRYLKEVEYSNRVARKLGFIGEDSVIASPCKLQGGGLKQIHIGNHTRIQSHSVIESWEKYGDQFFNPSIVIGNYCKFGEYFHITSCNKITIGDGLLTGRFVLITDNNHGDLSLSNADIPPIDRRLVSKGEIVIGDNVWIGDKVTILGGVHIGNNVIIGANSVVTKDIPSNTMAAGIPAKVLKQV